MKESIALIGPRYSGKSTLAPVLAQELKWQLISTDQWIIDNTGMSIETIVKKRGWQFFRELEYKCLVKIPKKKKY